MNKSIKVLLLILLLIFFSTEVYAAAPLAQTDPESVILSGDSVLVKGFVNPQGAVTEVVFQYGLTVNYTAQVTAENSPTGAQSNTVINMYGIVTGLTAGTNYHYRVKATNADGQAVGQDFTFTIPLSAILPNVVSDRVAEITSTSALVLAEIDFEGTSPVTDKGTCFNTTPNPDLSDFCVSLGTGGLGRFSTTLPGLDPGTFYYVRPFATNASGTSYGSQMTFTTLSTTAYVGPPGCYGKTPCYTTLQQAVDAVSTGTVILIPVDVGVGFSYGEIVLNSDKKITLFGGWDVGYFKPDAGQTTVTSLTIQEGSIVTDTITLKEP